MAGKQRPGLAWLVTAILLLTSAGHMFFVVPRYRRLLEGVGAEPSTPAQVALAASHFGLLFFGVVFLGIGVAFWLERNGRTGVLATVLSAAAVVSALYLAMVTFVYLDVARLMERIR